MSIRSTCAAYSFITALALTAGCATKHHAEHSARQMNQFTSSKQAHVAVAIDNQSRVLVAWDSRRQQGGRYGVYGRWADLSGQPIGDEFAINQHAEGHQMTPCVAADPTGGFWVAWTSTGQDGHGSGIVARPCTADQWQSEIAVNEHRSGHQIQPALAVNKKGQALIAWISETPTGQKLALRGIDPDGTPLGDEVHLESPATPALPRVVELPDDRFVVTWQITSDHPEGLVMQVVDADGQCEEPLHTLAGPGSIEASVDQLSDGAIVAWLTPNKNHYAIVMQKLDARGHLLDTPIEVFGTQDTEAWISGAHVASHPNDSWTLAWNEDTSGKGKNRVRIQTFDRHGTPIGEPKWLDEQLKPGHQIAMAASTSAMATSPSGNRVIGFSGKGTGPDSSAANLYVLDPLATTSTSSPATETMPPMLASTPMPPTFDPDFIPLDPMPRARDTRDNAFEGISNTGWTPPDPDIAVGPDHIVEVVNGGIAAYTLDGTQLFQTPIEGGGGFWGSVGAPSFVFDPEVIWDPHSRRFMAMANARSGSDSYFLLAVSETDQADGPWHKYLIDVSSFDSNIDSPNLSVDDSFIYVSADFFSPDKYLILCIKKENALVGAPLSWNQLSLSGSGNQSLGMPVSWDPGVTQYLLQSSEGTGNGVGFDEIRMHAIQNQTLDPTLITYDLPVETYSYPAHPPQQGTSVRPYLFEPRFWSCVQRGGSIWAVHHVDQDRSRVRWYEISLNGWPNSPSPPSVAQWGEIDAGQGISTYFPAITVDGLGNAAVTFARSSPNEYISMYTAKRAASDPPGTFQPMELAKQSSAADTSGRWGDYAGAAPDPDADGKIWLGHEWTNGGGWRTWITEVEFDVCIADINGDGTVNVTDLLQVIASFGQCPNCIEDMDGDGFVGIFEILTLLDTWGPC